MDAKEAEIAAALAKEEEEKQRELNEIRAARALLGGKVAPLDLDMFEEKKAEEVSAGIDEVIAKQAKKPATARSALTQEDLLLELIKETPGLTFAGLMARVRQYHPNANPRSYQGALGRLADGEKIVTSGVPRKYRYYLPKAAGGRTEGGNHKEKG